MQRREMPKTELDKYEAAGILVTTNLLLGRYDSISNSRPRNVLNNILSHRIEYLAVMSKAEMENLRAEELRKGMDSVVLEAKQRFLGFEKFRGKSGSIHIDHANTTISIKGFATVVANEYFRTGEMGYYELEIVEVGKMFFGFVTSEFERTQGHCNLGVGDDKHGWCVSGSSRQGHAGHRTAFGSTWKRGDVIGLACDLKLGLLHVSVNGSFEGPNGVACALSLAPPGLYPAFSASSGKVKYNLTRPFIHPPPLIPVETDTDRPREAGQEQGALIAQDAVQQQYISIWECRVKAAEEWKEPQHMSQARRNANRKQMTAKVMHTISQLCPTEYSLEMAFADSRVQTTPRIVVVIVDDKVAGTREDFREEVEKVLGPAPLPSVLLSIRDQYERKMQSHLDRLTPVRTRLATVRDSCPGCVFIPFLLPGWDAHLRDAGTEVSDWWPEGPCELHRHPLAIHLQREEECWWDSIQDQLLPKLDKHLTEWRGEKSPMLEAICCPTCLKTNGGVAPFCFDRHVCSRQMKNPTGRGTCRNRVQQCPACQRAKREPHMFELVKPEVYISHCVNSHSNLRALIAAIYESVGSNVNCMCWPPLEKAETLLKTDVETHNRSCIKNAKTVIVCLSDHYLRSERCLAEFRSFASCFRVAWPVFVACTMRG